MNENEIVTEEILPDEEPAEALVIEEEETTIPAVEEPSVNIEEIKALKNQLAELQLQLDESRAMYGKLHAECMEFSEIYPDVPLSTIPDSIWESVKSGIPLSAAYALAEKKEALARARADGINSKNKSLSSGSINTSKSEDFFSPAEVKAMSAAEVRANYAKIITSMSKWH